MSDLLVSHHALEGFLAQPETNTTESAALTVDILPSANYVNIRGHSNDEAFLNAVRSTFGMSLPVSANTVARDVHSIYWMGPDEWLIQTDEAAASLIDTFRKDNTGHGSSAVDVGDGYVSLRIAGARAADVLSKGCTLDLHPNEFTTGQCAQTAIARAAVLLAPAANGPGFDVVVRRTFAEYLALWLRHAAAEYGVMFRAPEK